MSFFSLAIERELFLICNSRNNRQNSKVDLNRTKNYSVSVVDLSKIVFSKPRLSKNFIGFLNFPFLALSNGGLLFYNFGYINFLYESNYSKLGALLFDDLYSYKNKIVF